MKQQLFTVFALVSLILGTTSAMSATPVALRKEAIPLLNGLFHQTSGMSTIANKYALITISNHKDFNQVYHQRVQQTYQGVPVVGGAAIIHSKKINGFAERKAKVTGIVFKNLEPDLGVMPKLNGHRALTKLEQDYKENKITEEKSQLIVFIDEDNKAHWAYKVSFLAQDENSIPKRPSAFIDATTFKALVTWNDIKTLKEKVYASGYGGNERVGLFSYGFQNSESESFPLLEITRDSYKKKCFMETEQVKIVDMGGEYYSYGSAMTFDCAQESAPGVYSTGYNNDGFDSFNGAYSPSNDALYMGFVINHMYKDWYNKNALEVNGKPMQIVMRVHYGSKFENAFWDGKQMTYGDGANNLHPLVSMGIGAHEISHGFTQHNSNLAYYSQSGGMNESFSDMAAMAAIYYAHNEEKDPSFQIGDDIMKKGNPYGDSLRSMDRPSQDGHSIDYADDYHPNLNVHHSSGVYNRLFYLLATTSGWNTHKAFDVMVKANTDYWSSHETFKTGSCGVLAAANDYGYSISDIKTALDNVHINYSECEIGY